ncbi:MAG: glycoside hydrolase family 2 TIM barrel-domain containing protein [bacterium]
MLNSHVSGCAGLAMLLSCAFFCRAAEVSAEGGRQTLSFDQGWRFHLGDVAGGEKPALDDAAWRAQDVPHDFSIEGPPGTNAAAMDGPFDPKSPGGESAGALNGGVGWYRKTFTLPEAAKGKRAFVLFDGVYMDSEVWLNGVSLGRQPYGYTSFEYDLTPHLKPGGNVLAVRVNVQQPCSRWYSGAGIYRHVWLTLTGPVHVALWGTCVTTPAVLDASAEVLVRTQVRNEGAEEVKATLTTTVVDAEGKQVAEQQTAETLAANGSHAFAQALKVAAPRRWSVDDPHLYRAVSEIRVGGRLADRYETPFGIRTIAFTADNGFLLNGRRVQIKGVCNHHDLGCLGAAVHRRGIERQLEILKAMGCNAVRTSHNPPAPELLELCDRMGLLVMDEVFDEWVIPKSGIKYSYGRFFEEWSERDLVSMLRRDRNHPSVILWSIGNEIKEQAAPQGGAMARRLADICRREDPTRPVTSGMNKLNQALANGFADALDVAGINYFTAEYQRQRGRVLIASETSSALSTRGEYGLELKPDGTVAINKRRGNQCVSYDLDRPGWGCTAEDSLLALKNAPWVAGEFVWTGFDYIGEPTPYDWPSRSSYFGIIDLAGFPKDRYYLYQSQWSDKPVLHLLPHWNWKGFEGKEIPVWCFTSAESVELFLNGKSLGSKTLKDSKSLHLEWKVPYEPGVLKAVGKKGGQTLTAEVRTAGEPARLILRPDRTRIAADGEDLSFVEVRVVDKDGTLCPDADRQVAFSIEGPGEIAGVDNGDPASHEPFQATRRKAFHGLCLAVVKAGRTSGAIRLSAAAQGLQSEPAVITAVSESVTQ